MAIILKLTLHSEFETYDFAHQLAQCAQLINNCIVIYLEGDLGIGKTTLARGFIQFYGFDRVKSPTYSLVESYINDKVNIHHFDCYRLSDAQELEYIGIREYLAPNHIQLIEWANLGKGMIAPADMVIKITNDFDKRELEIIAYTQVGSQLLTCINL
ncbi:protein of unknown function UPF0079 [Candidatus Ruthia magnifica str. Cm (Calyptogena magnifica)]|uniref:tRNA threonylcarbamoyladenosine biosynthesis protein TsaE n=1 Tax=Ruthia magnifica subsp. Calyptogena magnifica TaxID=413404 RepID=A1AXB6_RUTMC|nr:tRNA (adenosine(37)-N6)-threonylcarbamoyltransferase complex ATPase subunit type 1 TsaE [Candidatus Ruthturnera calyptogenae]ABL02573.1 protein of unknown function UPF0079 [Candidatus Ruthia magnifica str. Cm (Calyptogena magnifica)]